MNLACGRTLWRANGNGQHSILLDIGFVYCIRDIVPGALDGCYSAMFAFQALSSAQLFWSINASRVLYEIFCIVASSSLMPRCPEYREVALRAALIIQLIMNAVHSILADSEPKLTNPAPQRPPSAFTADADLPPKIRVVGKNLCRNWRYNMLVQLSCVSAVVIVNGSGELWGYLALYSLHWAYIFHLRTVVSRRSLRPELQNNTFFNVILLKYTWLWRGIISLLFLSVFCFRMAGEMLADKRISSNEFFVALVCSVVLPSELNAIVSVVMRMLMHRFCPAETLQDLLASLAAINRTINA